MYKTHTKKVGKKMFKKIKQKTEEKKELMRKLNENKIYKHYKTTCQLLDEVLNKQHEYEIKSGYNKNVSIKKRKGSIEIEIISFTGDYFSLSVYDGMIKIAKFYVDTSYEVKGIDYAVLDIDGHYVQSDKLTKMRWEPAKEVLEKLWKIGKMISKNRKSLLPDALELL